jgi:hypothetical protein
MIVFEIFSFLCCFILFYFSFYLIRKKKQPMNNISGQKYNVETKVVVIDFSGSSDPKIFKEFEDTVSNLDIGVLSKIQFLFLYVCVSFT